MSILDEVVVNAKNVATTACKKAGQIVDFSKLKFNEAELESDISKKFQALGKLVYEATRDSSLTNDIDDMIEEIDSLYLHLETVRDQINVMRKKKACPNCKKVNDDESVYCSACGTLLSAAEKEEASEE